MTPTPGSPEPDANLIAANVTERAGLSFDGPRRCRLLQQIIEAMAQAGAGTVERYLALLEGDEDEFDELVARISVGESYFFREPNQLDLLRATILPERRAALGPSAALQLWSAGCATGQEPYTLAIVLEEEGLAGKARILATDISRGALRVAAAGVYGKWSLRAVTEQQREAYFHTVPGGYRIDERFAPPITFRQLNLLDPRSSEPRRVDVIFCRNVLIYFTPEAVVRVAERLTASLTDGGWLVTGSSDPPLEGIAGLEPTVTPLGLVYRRPSPAARHEADTVGTVTATLPTSVTRARHIISPATSTIAPRPEEPSEPAPIEAEGDADEAARLVRALGGAGDLAGARATVGEAIARFPVHTELRFLQAVVLMEAGRPAEAAAAARAALYLDPSLVMAHVTLAQAEATLGNQQAARRSLRNAASLLRALPPGAPVTLSDGEPAGRLAAMVATHERAVAADGHRGERGNG